MNVFQNLVWNLMLIETYLQPSGGMLATSDQKMCSSLLDLVHKVVCAIDDTEIAEMHIGTPSKVLCTHGSGQ